MLYQWPIIIQNAKKYYMFTNLSYIYFPVLMYEYYIYNMLISC